MYAFIAFGLYNNTTKISQNAIVERLPGKGCSERSSVHLPNLPQYNFSCICMVAQYALEFHQFSCDGVREI